MTIVELKYDCKWDPQASQIINGLSGRISKNSKYIDGVEFLSKNYKYRIKHSYHKFILFIETKINIIIIF